MFGPGTDAPVAPPAAVTTAGDPKVYGLGGTPSGSNPGNNKGGDGAIIIFEDKLS